MARMQEYELQWTESGLADPGRLRLSVTEAGFAVVRDVLRPDEVEHLREAIRRGLALSGSRLGLGRTQPNASVALPELTGIFAHPRIVAVVKSLLGDDNVVFTGHCDAHMNMLSGWHKDSGEAFGGYFRSNCFVAPDCRVYKIGIYLQDSDLRSALRVRPGSHRRASLEFGEALRIDTRVGDIVVFDVRLSHAGQLPDTFEKAIKAVNMLFTRNDRTREDARFASTLKSAYWKLLGRKDRLSVFFTYGYPNEHTNDFSYFNIMRQARQSHVCDSRLPSELSERLRSLGVASYDPATHELWAEQNVAVRRSA
jgi:hypothetical protein